MATNLSAWLPAWTDTQAVAINNLGDILGYGEYQGGQYGFLLKPMASAALFATPVPELSTWAMLIVGFAGLGLAGYRRPAKALSRQPASDPMVILNGSYAIE